MNKIKKIMFVIIIMFVCLVVSGCKNNSSENVNNLSAFDIFIKHYPEYKGTEKEWITDVAKGKICNLFGHEYIEKICKNCGGYLFKIIEDNNFPKELVINYNEEKILEFLNIK